MQETSLAGQVFEPAADYCVRLEMVRRIIVTFKYLRVDCRILIVADT